MFERSFTAPARPDAFLSGGGQDEPWSMLAHLKPPAHPDLDLDGDGLPEDEIFPTGPEKPASLQRQESLEPGSTFEDEMDFLYSLSVTTEESEAGHRLSVEEMNHFDNGFPEVPMMRKVTSTSSFRKHAVRARRERIRAERREEVSDFLKGNNFAGVNAPRSRLGFRFLSESVYPLHVAAQKGDAKMVQELLRERADPDKRNSAGQTALDMAHATNQFGSHRMVLEILSGRWNTMTFRDLRAISSPGI
ncbi:unnamed protein product [Symbiodinium sp. CCMP2456]|nr:unnamed protein product [Symbiodinium sp. CCMP2456]